MKIVGLQSSKEMMISVDYSGYIIHIFGIGAKSLTMMK